MGSQSDVFQELHELQMQNHHVGDMKHAHQYQLSYELALDISHVIHELVTTERSYVKHLSEIVEVSMVAT